MPDTNSQSLSLRIGLGEAIQRLIAVERRYAHQHSALPEELLTERDMIVTALNNFRQIDLNIACEIPQPGAEDELTEPIPENVQIFAHSVKTSCCRLVRDETLSEPKKSIVQRVFDPIMGIWTTPAKK